jgi:uncharacterized protein (DUF1800 family)
MRPLAARIVTSGVACLSTLLIQLVFLDAAIASPPAAPGGLRPLAVDTWDVAKARHLLARAGFGGTPEEVAKLEAMGLRGAVDFLVDYQKQPQLDLPFDPAQPDREQVATLRNGTPEQKRTLAQQQRQQDMSQLRDLRQWWIKRMLQTQRPLEEKLALFWHGHFATEHRTVRNSSAMYLQNQLFREHASGNFAALLHAIVHDAAMLRYLDNNRNVKGKPNENLAREIMELFALGEGNYTEQDIKEGARALTGYGFERLSGEFRFNRFAHDTGEKTIFGQTGDWDGDQFVDLILKHPAAAPFIARKLFVFFVHDSPDDATIDHLAGVFRENNYELAPLLKTMLLSQEFYGERAVGTQIKSPVQLVVGTLRTLGLHDMDAPVFALAIRTMGQDLFDPPNVKGWDGGAAWINTNTLFARDNFSAMLIARGANLSMPAVSPTGAKRNRAAGRGQDGALLRGLNLAGKLDIVAPLEAQQLQSSAAVVDYLSKTFLAVPLNDAKRNELVQFLGPLPPSRQWASQRDEIRTKIGGLLVLLMSMPEYQLT